MKQIIVDEGIHDLNKIKEVYEDANVLITNGREISEETLNIIRTHKDEFEFILFLDPDAPGERIRNEILKIVPNAKNAFLPKKKGISKNHKKVGIEHAKNEDIIEALSKVYEYKPLKEEIKMSDLYNLGLIGNDSSKIIRDKISLELNIGAPNAKTFLNRLNQFGISLDRLKELMAKYEWGKSKKEIWSKFLNW